MRRSVLQLILCLVPVFTARANIVVNPGFETGDLTGWTSSQWDVTGIGPEAGQYTAFTFCSGPECTEPASPLAAFLYQDLSTMPSLSYSLSFWLNTGLFATDGSQLKVLWNNLTVADYINLDTGNQYRLMMIPNLQVSGATTRLEFLGRQDPNVIFLDSISVDPSAPVPEPATPLLFVFGTLMIFRRRSTI